MKQSFFRRLLSATLGVCVMTSLTLSAAPGLTLQSLAATPDETGVVIGNVRVQALSETIVRVELKGPNGFEDRETYNICNRDFTLLPTTVHSQNGVTSVTTDAYTVLVPDNATSLRDISIHNSEGRSLWTYAGMPSTREYLPDPGDTPEAYAIADSPRIVPAEWGMAQMPEDNTAFPDLNGWDVSNDSPDLYVLLPGGDYRRLLKDFITLTGSSEMIPLKAFGLWYSKYSNISQADALQDIDDFRDHSFPLDYFGVDTDWRVGGREGYELNTSKWPDLEGFLDTAHNEKNVKVYFNDHAKPVSGVMFDDNALTDGKSALGKAELAYRTENLTHYLDMGLDMWWYDRNWPYSVLSPFETMGISRDNFGMYVYQSIQQLNDPDARPMIMGNVDGVDSGILARPSNLTSHRYSVQWTGDTMCSMDGLSADIATMVNSGVLSANPYVTHDNGGHAGTQSGASYLRWVQFGAFSPVFRFHSSGTDTDRAPWLYSGAEDAAREYVNLRYRLLPVYYSLAHENYVTGLPILRRLDINYPGYVESRDDSQYLLGDNLLVAPLTSYNASGTSSRSVFIPDGTWTNLFTGESVTGPKTITVTCDSNTMPLFVRSGSILPTVEEVSYIGEKDWSNVALDVYPSTTLEGTFTLYEDDTETVAYKNGQYRETLLSTGYDASTGEVTVDIGKAVGSFDGDDAFDTRTWTVRVHAPSGWGAVTSATLNGSPITLTKISKVSGSYPLGGAGAAGAEDVYEVTFSAKLDKASALRFTFNAKPAEILPEYNENSVTMSHTSGTMTGNLELSSLSPMDSIRFTNDGITEQNGGRFTGLVTTGKNDFSGSVSVNGDIAALGLGSGTVSFDVAVPAGESQLTLFLGANKASVQVEITDGSNKHAKVVTFTNLSGARYDKLAVQLYADTATTIHVKVSKSKGSGDAALYAATLSDTYTVTGAAVNFESYLSDAPSTANFSAAGVIDWVHLGYGSSSSTITRKKDANLLSDPIITGSTSSLTSYTTVVSFGGGTPNSSASGNQCAIRFENAVEFTVPVTTGLRELKIYTGVNYATNTVDIWDEAGSPVTSYQFSHSSTSNKCLTVQFSAETDTVLHVRLRRTYGRTGTICLAGYTLSEITEADRMTSELRSLIAAQESKYTQAELKPYEPTTVTAYLDALSAAKVVSRKDPVTQEEIDKVTAALIAADAALVKGSSAEETNRIPSNAVATASGEGGTGYVASYAIDSSRDGTRWAAPSGGASSTDWLSVDLGSAMTFDHVSIYWESVSRNYAIQVSNDGTNWTTVATDSSRTERAGTRLTTHAYFDTVTARYVRMYSTSRSTDAFGGAYLSVLDFKVSDTGIHMEQTTWDKLAALVDNPVADVEAYSDASAAAYTKALEKARSLFAVGETRQNLLSAALTALETAIDGLVEKEYNAALSATATASQATESGKTADKAMDGSMSTRWASANGGADQTLTLDLGEVLTVHRVSLFWESASNAYTVDVSLDGNTWTTVVTNSQSVSAGTGTGNLHQFDPVEARYVRLHSKKGAPGLGTYLSLYEFEVYALNQTDLLPGDVDGNGTVAAADLTRLARHVGNIEVIDNAVCLAAGDVDGDGSLGAADMTRLARLISGIE